ncbi:MAG: cytochrome P450 [Actinomycetota bacterium]|nr:cytochrome P450 [Actinomycetota bacterium]
MRNRPVIPMIVRMVNRPWRLGTTPWRRARRWRSASSPCIIENLYPDPLSFRPERFLEHGQPDDPGDERSGEAGSLAFVRPGTYTWLPFGGGIRRCLGASLAMAEQRVVLDVIARRTDQAAPDLQPERARQRNVTTIPARVPKSGSRLVTRSDRARRVLHRNRCRTLASAR